MDIVTKQTVLYDEHVKLGADMVDFAGYMMPVRYKTSIVDEHIAVREQVGMFDTSHMGRYWITGKDAKEYLDYLVPRNVMKLTNGGAGYTFMLNESGGFRDDVIITQFSEEEFMLVCNAGNREKIWNWMNAFVNMWRKAGKDAVLEDRSNLSCMIAVQGPKAYAKLQKLFGVALPEKRFKAQWIEYDGDKILFTTTGYTGSAGGEIILFGNEENFKQKSSKMWNTLLDLGIVPCALGSRDTLRMEAGYRLYGNDLNEDMNLLESGLDFYPFADIENPAGYVGQSAILRKRGKVNRVFVGFELLGRGIARHEYDVKDGDKVIGHVLSGTQSPLSKKSFGMAMVDVAYKELGSKFAIDIRGKPIDAVVIKFPIYDETKYGVLVHHKE